MEPNIAQFLTPKQRTFCDEYLAHGNATTAALQAGYSKETALSGYLMRMPKIRLYLQQEMDVVSAKAKVNHEMILSELCKIAFGNMGSYFNADGGIKPMHELTDDAKGALWSVSVGDVGSGSSAVPVTKFRMYNKLAALDKIAKHLNFYNPEQQQPEVVYRFLDQHEVKKDDRFDAYGLQEDMQSEQRKAAEHAEELKEREWVEKIWRRTEDGKRFADVLRKEEEEVAVAGLEEEGKVAVAGSNKEEVAEAGNDVEIPKNTEVLGDAPGGNMVEMASARTLREPLPDTFATHIANDDEIPKNTEDLGDNSRYPYGKAQ